MMNIAHIGPRSQVPAGGGGGGSLPDRSLSFTSSSSMYLSISDANFGAYDRAKFAWSGWWKRANTTAGTYYLFSHIDAAANDRGFRIFLNSSHKINFNTSANGTSTNGNMITTATYNNTTWHHILVWYDSANATAGDRMRMWIDGSEITSFDTDTNPNAAINNSAAPIAIGSNSADTAGASYWNGLIYQSAFFSGTLPNISSVYNSGAAVDVTGVTGLWSLLNTTNAGTLEDDYVLSNNWTNNNSVTKSTTIP